MTWLKIGATDTVNFGPVHLKVENGVAMIASDFHGEPSLHAIVLEPAQLRYMAEAMEQET